MLPSRFYENTYTEADTKRLCDTSGLKPADLGAFRKTLEDCAAIYRWEAAKHKDIPRHTDLRRELAVPQTRLRSLRAALAGLSNEARSELDLGVFRKADQDAMRHITGNLDADAPALVLPLLNPDQSVSLDLADLEKLLGGLEDALSQAVDRLPNQRRGQSRDYGLRLWITNIRDLWQSTTSTPFTRDATADNEPITPAADFCVNAFKMIEPKYPNSRILRELKDCIARQKITGRIVAQNEQ
ncbi:hypothetical protein O5O51_15425 [Sinirhodobacter sp. HNIBRBA609]|nr:hypothetical protein O5O51_15425 [Sinirhodobacter sp. HNIBRBA609]